MIRGIFNYGWASQKFGAARGRRRRHAGIDLGTGGKKGIPVGCPLSGFKVASVRWRSGYGNTVDLVSLDGTKMMRFAHLANPLPKHLKVGAVVNQGDWLGDVGNTGGNYAIHLHFEYRIKQGNNFVPVNPFGNKYHTFCQDDFERSTQMAYASRKAVRSGKGLVSVAAPVEAQQTDAYSDTTPQPTQTPSVATTRPVKKSKKGKNQSRKAEMPQEVVRRPEPVGPTTPYQPVWTLNRGFNQPTWWERHAPEFLGGWSKEELKEAEERRKLDEEVFKGVRRGELLNIGLTNDDISKLQTHVNAKMAERNISRTLYQSGVAVNFNQLYADKDKAAAATEFFLNKNSETTRGGMA